MGTNPYQPPVTESVYPARHAISGLLPPGERIELDFDLTEEHLTEIYRRSPLRTDLRRLRSTTWFFIAIQAILVPALLLSVFVTNQIGWMLAGFSGLLAALQIYQLLNHRRVVRRLVRSNADRLGRNQGYLDEHRLVLRDQHQERVTATKHWFAATSTPHLAVISSDPGNTMVNVIPYSGCQPAERMIAAMHEIIAVIPPRLPESQDERRLQVPEDAPEFEPGPDAIFFSGPITFADARGSTFYRRYRSAQRREGAQVIAIFLLTLVGIQWATGMFWATSIAALYFVWITFSLFRRMAGNGGASDTVITTSKGWIDGEAIVSISAVGQTRARWSMFGLAEATDTLMQIQAFASENWHIASRQQFQSESEWEAAKAIVANRVMPVGSANG